MQKNLRYYIDFTTDLQRVVNCLVHDNNKTANIFFRHAINIYREKINPSIETKYFPVKLQNHWNEISLKKLPANKRKQLLFADKILTISTILFRRTYHYAFN